MRGAFISILSHTNCQFFDRSRVGVAVLNGKLYAFGGFNGTERLSTVEVYDPRKNKWSQGCAMLCKRSAVGVAALDDCIYVCGGYDGVTSLNTVEVYYPKSNTWKTVSKQTFYVTQMGKKTDPTLISLPEGCSNDEISFGWWSYPIERLRLRPWRS